MLHCERFKQLDLKGFPPVLPWCLSLQPCARCRGQTWPCCGGGKRNTLPLAFAPPGAASAAAAIRYPPPLVSGAVVPWDKRKHPKKPSLSLLFLLRLRERHTLAREPGTGNHRSKTEPRCYGFVCLLAT